MVIAWRCRSEIDLWAVDLKWGMVICSAYSYPQVKQSEIYRTAHGMTFFVTELADQSIIRSLRLMRMKP